MNFGIIISSNSRSISYLRALIKNNISISKIIFLRDKNNKKVNQTIFKILKNIKEKKKIKIFDSKNINNSKISDYLNKTELKTFIVSLYSGASGIIKNKNLLRRKKFIHSHPGKLPNYKGSTTIYYSILKEQKIWCDTFFLNEKIDEGNVILSKKYPLPRNIHHIEKDYDIKIRTDNLIQSIKKLNLKKSMKVRVKAYKNLKKSKLNYYVIHPILRHIVYKKFQNV